MSAPRLAPAEILAQPALQATSQSDPWHNAETWTRAYFANRGHVPTAQQYRVIFDAALGHFLKLANES